MEPNIKDSIESAMDIIVELINKGIIEKDLKTANYFSDESVREIVEIFAEKAKLYLFDDGYSTICVIPDINRGVFNLSKTELLHKYKIDQENYLIFLFIVFSIFSIFIDQGNEDVRIDLVINHCNSKIKMIEEEKSKIDINEKYNWNFEGVIKQWNELKDVTNLELTDRAGKTSKYGMVIKTIKILEQEGVLVYLKQMSAIKTNQKTYAVTTMLTKNNNILKLKDLIKGSV